MSAPEANHVEGKEELRLALLNPYLHAHSWVKKGVSPIPLYKMKHAKWCVDSVGCWRLRAYLLTNIFANRIKCESIRCDAYDFLRIDGNTFSTPTKLVMCRQGCLHAAELHGSGFVEALRACAVAINQARRMRAAQEVDTPQKLFRLPCITDPEKSPYPTAFHPEIILPNDDLAFRKYQWACEPHFDRMVGRSVPTTNPDGKQVTVERMYLEREDPGNWRFCVRWEEYPDGDYSWGCDDVKAVINVTNDDDDEEKIICRVKVESIIHILRRLHLKDEDHNREEYVTSSDSSEDDDEEDFSQYDDDEDEDSDDNTDK